MNPSVLYNRIKIVLNANPLLILFLYWTLTQLVVVSFKGVKTSVDTSLYLDGAQRLLSNVNLENAAHDFWYVSYCAFLAPILYWTDSLEAVVAFQILFSGLALLALYKGVLTISNDQGVSFIACFLYVFWFEIHTWNIFIYTESLFTSFSIITFYFLVQSKKNWQYGITIALMIFTCLIRPAGFSLLIASISYFFVKSKLPVKSKVFLALAACPLVFVLLNKMLETYELTSSYAMGEIIYPKVKVLISEPELKKLPTSNFPVIALVEFVCYYPVYFCKLCAVKLFLFFGHVKPYFSVLHNWYIVLVLYPLYGFAIRGFRIARIEGPVRVFLLALVSLQAITIMLTYENWDGRFLIPILPFIFILSGFGIKHFLQTRISVL